MSKELIRLRDLCMAFDDELVLDHINLYINDKEFLTLLGPSGCGKTTTLRIIGGFATPTSGDVLFDGVRINDVPPYQRQINTVFQKYALFPHLNVFNNIAFGLKIKKIPSAEIEKMVASALERMQIGQYSKRYPTELSGGQQQRVAIARALVPTPSTIIADEPTGNLDPARSFEIMALLQEINNLGTTVLVVTHEKNLVELFAKRVIAIDDGYVVSDGRER